MFLLDWLIPSAVATCFQKVSTSTLYTLERLFTRCCERSYYMCFFFTGRHPTVADCLQPPGSLWLLWTLQPWLWLPSAQDPGSGSQHIREWHHTTSLHTYTFLQGTLTLFCLSHISHKILLNTKKSERIHRHPQLRLELKGLMSTISYRADNLSLPLLCGHNSFMKL